MMRDSHAYRGHPYNAIRIARARTRASNARTHARSRAMHSDVVEFLHRGKYKCHRDSKDNRALSTAFRAWLSIARGRQTEASSGLRFSCNSHLSWRSRSHFVPSSRHTCASFPLTFTHLILHSSPPAFHSFLFFLTCHLPVASLRAHSHQQRIVADTTDGGHVLTCSKAHDSRIAKQTHVHWEIDKTKIFLFNLILLKYLSAFLGGSTNLFLPCKKVDN